MHNRDDWIELELSKQVARLRYIDAAINGKVVCDLRPRRIFIEPTNACNVNCIHCVHDGQMTRPLGFMDMDVYRKIMADIKGWQRTTEICLFQQGEPLLHKDIVEMIRLASLDGDFFVKMNTNGVALTKELSEALIRNHLDYLVFSLDAISPETYEQIKRRPYFHKVINNILDYLEIWGSLDIGEVRNYFACDVILLKEEANKAVIETFKEMFERLPVGHVEVYELFNYMGAIEEANAKYPERHTTARENWPCCNSPWDVLGVRWNGDAVACIYDYDARYVIGNVTENSIMEIWNSERMQQFRQALIDRNYEKIETNGDLCSNCTIMWMDDYHLPTDFYAEIGRMENYLVRAIDRVARRWPRTDKLMAKHKYLMAHRQEWMEELKARGEQLAGQQV